MSVWQQIVAVGTGGFVGAVARFGLSTWVARRCPESAHLGTLAVNVLGCLLIGGLVVWIEAREHVGWVRALVVTGMLGSLTTFSTFGHETVELVRGDRLRDALLHVTANLTVGLLAVLAGAWIAGRMLDG